MIISVNSDLEMRQLGACVATLLQDGSVLYLSGPIGAGKTTLTQGLLAAAGIDEAVTSPTFSLVEGYSTTTSGMPAQIWHFDLYRLEQPEELEFIGARDCFNANDAVVVEWPERGAGFLPTPDVHFFIEFFDLARAEDKKKKQSEACAVNEVDEQRLLRLKTDFENSVRINDPGADRESVLSPRQVTVNLNK